MGCSSWEGVIFYWIFAALSNLMESLQDRRQDEKLAVHAECCIPHENLGIAFKESRKRMVRHVTAQLAHGAYVAFRQCLKCRAQEVKGTRPYCKNSPVRFSSASG
eukprot:2146562-Amphidinium_carterae.1